jgi:N-acylneuraminate cytidylyltransferase/CMP-N,N'-diacetyllegionaminic acid synthase
VGVGKTEGQNPAFLINMNNEGYISGYEDKSMSVKRRQDISEVFFFEGSVYISKIESLLNNKSFYHDKTIGYEFPKYKTLEIDSMDDFIMVEAIMRHKRRYT